MVLFVGCAKYKSSNNFISIKVGMEKSDVIKKLGKPAVARGSIMNKFGQVVEVFEYKVDMGIDTGEAVFFSCIIWPGCIIFTFLSQCY